MLQSIVCSRCGQRGHSVSSISCPAKNVKCNKCCGLIGHYARRCQTKSIKRKTTNVDFRDTKKRKIWPSKIQFISDGNEAEGVSGERIQENNCFRILSEESPAVPASGLIKCYIGGHGVVMLIDSGSRYNLLSEKDWAVLNSNER